MNGGVITISGTDVAIVPIAPIWMIKSEIADIFGILLYDIHRAIRAIYKNKELNEAETVRYIRQPDGISYDAYNFEMIITITSKIRSKGTLLFRRSAVNETCATKKGNPVTLFVSYGKSNNPWYS